MKIENAKIRDNGILSNSQKSLSRVSIFSEGTRNEIVYLKDEQLVPYHKQARVIFDQEEIDNLALTIKEHGIQTPLTVLRTSGNTTVFEVVSGERRLRAARQIGLRNIPCIIISDQEKAEEIALIENIQRQNLHQVELANSIKDLINQRGHGAQSEIGRKLGLSKSQVSELVKLASFSEEIKGFLLTHKVRGRELYRKMFQMKSDDEIMKFLKKIVPLKSEISTKPTRVSTSVLRISFSDESFKIQKSYLTKLSDEQKKNLKEKLEELIQEL